MSIHFDLHADETLKYILAKSAYTSSFIGLLLLLSWWYGESSFDQRFDPVAAANDERDVAVKERDDAQRAWGEMGTKHEQALKSVLELQNEINKSFKDLPWLKKKNSELTEENAVQHNKIEHLKSVQKKYDDLLRQASTYGMSAQRPEHYQRNCEHAQRQLEIANNLLRGSQIHAKTLEEKLEAQSEQANQEKRWLRAKLTKNSRSTAYWAKFCVTDGVSEIKPAWGIRCACTEPETAYSLKDQTPRIVELETTVAARDLTILRLRGSRWNALENSTTWEPKATLPSGEIPISGTSPGAQTTPTALAHTCEHEQQCKDLGQQVKDDATTIRQLRKECQDLKDAASSHSTTSAAEMNAKAKFQKELTEKDAVIKILQEEKITKGEELAVKNEEMGNLRQEVAEEAREKRAEWERESRQQKTEIDGLKETIKERDLEINDLEEANQEYAVQEAPESSETLQRLKTANTNLDELRRRNDEYKGLSETQAVKINELETTVRDLEGKNNLKDNKIAGLEGQINKLEAAGRDSDAATKFRDDEVAGLEKQINELKAAGRELEVANSLKDDNIVGLQEQINQLKAAGWELETTIKLKDDNIANLGVQISQVASRESVDQVNREYRLLYDHYYLVLGKLDVAEGKLKLAETTHNGDRQALDAMQQNDAAKQQDLQRVRNDYTTLRNLHQKCDGQINALRTQLRQGAHSHTDLQMKYTAQATELEKANQNVSELQTKFANLQKERTHVQQITSSSENDVEKYRAEGAERARPIWQAKIDRDLSAQASKLEASENKVFKLETQLRQAKADPLREVQLKSREDAVKLREDALTADNDAMDHDQQAPKEDDEIKAMEAKLIAANKEAGNAKLRNRGIVNELNKERKERKDEKERYERELKKEQEDAARRSEMLKLRLEADNPLKNMVSKLQNEVARLKETIEKKSG